MVATFKATPNPVPAGVGPGTTTITWSTGDGSVGRVYVSVNGGPEQPFAGGVQGSQDAPWIHAGATYEFSLYAERVPTPLLLSTLTIVRNPLFRRLDEYRHAIARHFPALHGRQIDRIDSWSIGEGDTYALECFLKHYPHKEVIVLDIGTFIGVSCFHFASQQKVRRVISVDVNHSLAKMHEWGIIAGNYEDLKDLKLLDVVDRALAEFPYEQQKIQLREGSLAGSGKVEVLAALEPTDSVPLVAFVDGDHSKEGVRADLEAIFEGNSDAVAILHDCSDHSPAGPSVRAGIASFLDAASRKYHFRPLAGLASSVKKFNLGIVYPDSAAPEMDQLLLELRQVWQREGEEHGKTMRNKAP